MTNFPTHFLIMTFFTTILSFCGARKVMMCYVTYWSVYRSDKGRFDMDQIEPHLCSHIIYAYRELNSTTSTVQSSDKWADGGIGNLRKLRNLRKVNDELKILMSIGGWSEGSEKFSTMSADKEKRGIFVQSVLQHLQANSLDGLDIDWQYPTKRGGKLEDKENFVTLLQELRKEFDKKNYTLTVRLMGSKYAAEGYALGAISDAVHYINLRSYSYHGSWESKTGPYSALTSSDEDNVVSSVQLFLNEGVAEEKLLLGLTTEGNAFLLEKTATPGNQFGQSFSEGFSGPWLDEKGVLSFYEVCSELTSGNWTEHWDEGSSTPYALDENRLSSYDNVKSIQLKMKLVEKKALGGVTVFTLDMDDFKGSCYGEKFILTVTAKRALRQFNFEATILNQQFT